MYVVQAYILSKGIFHSYTWLELIDQQYKVYLNSILDIHRDSTGQYYLTGAQTDMYSDNNVIYEYGLVNPLTIIRSARIQLFMRILRKRPLHLLELVIAAQAFSHGWARALMSDLHLLTLSDKYSECTSFDIPQWQQCFDSDLSTHARCIRKLCHSPIANIIDKTVPKQ